MARAALAVGLLVALAAKVGSADGDLVWLELLAPLQGQQIRRVTPLVEIRGQAGAGARLHHDIVLAIDVSSSTLLPTGSDVDGDGETGKLLAKTQGALSRLSAREWTSDYDDTIVVAEMQAARRLLEMLDRETMRVGLVVFYGIANLRSPVASPDEALERLNSRRMEHWIPKVRYGTDIATALDRAVEALLEAPPIEGREAQRTILLLSDGQHLGRGDQAGKQGMRSAAMRAAQADVRVISFGIGEVALEDSSSLEVAARYTGGRFVAVKDPALVSHALPRVALTGLEYVTLRNTTTDDPGHATRVFPDGSFDAYVPLATGSNTIEVTAHVLDGRETTRHVTVHFERPDPPSAADLRDAERLISSLRERTLETELAIRALGSARERERHLDLEVEQ